ncbi:STAS domain-containing protein [Parvibium lacunae]|uniref:Anti-sigma factor antagonist n=1 Tax=Parvibium lacunae TaxID=1888893 RepID=A0A368L765_9BURK|nr:STAS domain-containing protein [Parvibium lacunae]RCS59505.1 anti-sigma factor antagonist [Parvibium lacunae]
MSNFPMSKPYTILLQGVISAESASFFQKAVASVGGYSEVVFDFSQVIRINSMGIALLLKTLRELRYLNKKVAIFGANKMTMMLFKMMGVTQHATILDAPSPSAQTPNRNGFIRTSLA